MSVAGPPPHPETGAGAAEEDGLVAGAAPGVEAGEAEGRGEIGEVAGDAAVAVGLGIVIVVGPREAGGDPAGGVPGAPAHAARRTPRRRDAARRFAFICRRR